ncbi:efflux RND transporter periplasmic adaptor subunit [Betaproteobacteria bacterium PRO7]|jgi:membrane fusion protein (multidrug efflux system)|nr:efflux RND transporter periplasmic adaptor subunit [Betaproteobacteria bacterium PRO7]
MNATILTQSRRVRAVTAAAAAALLASTLAACSGGNQHGGFGGFPPAPVTLLQVKAATVPVRFEYVGQTAGSKEAEVRARVQGILERRTYQEGGAVKAGQTMFVIDPKPYAAQVQQAEAALAQAEAQLAQAKRLAERLKPLVGDKAVSQREYDDAASAEETAAAGVKLAQARLTEARLNLSYTTVTAPVSGFASRAQKSEGSLVSPGADSLLTTVSQIDPLHVNFSVSENEKLRFDKLVAEGRLVLPDPKKGALEVTLRLADGSVFPRKGKLSFIDARINPATGSFDARAEIANPDGVLHPGQFVRVQLNGAARPNAIVVPQRAVMDGPQGKFVYVAAKSPEGKDIALPRPVTVGDWVEIEGANQWIVESGLKPGDQVVVEGMAKIFPIPTGAPIVVGPPPGADAANGGPAKGEVKKK